MQLFHLTFGITVLLLYMTSQPSTVESQTVLSPFAYVCRQTCGGYGVFRRMCCFFDEVCCTKPNECPEDPGQDTLFPICQSCSNDVDCMWTAKCCEHDGKKCCTPLRSNFLRRNPSQRAKEKIGMFKKNNSTNSIKEEVEEETEK
ncbi:hypothetical protein CHUAL_008279 [Chamberlinius hualienensis]